MQHYRVICDKDIDFYNTNGFVVLKGFVDPDEINSLLLIQDELERYVNSESYKDLKLNKNELVAPSSINQSLKDKSAHTKSNEVAKTLLGSDMFLDFDIMLNRTKSESYTAWHQDKAYWVPMTDKRALCCTIALDNTTIDSGCTWVIPGTHKKPVRPHFYIDNEMKILGCDGSESEALPIMLRKGDLLVLDSGVVHYNRSNNTIEKQRYYVLNYRPLSMIKHEEKLDFDSVWHRKIRGVNGYKMIAC